MIWDEREHDASTERLEGRLGRVGAALDLTDGLPNRHAEHGRSA